MALEDTYAKLIQEGKELVKNDSSENVYAKLMQNKTEGTETITFAKDDWQHMANYLNEIEARLMILNQLTPVINAHGLCKVTTCQWNELSAMREKADIDTEKLRKMYIITDGLVDVMTRLISEKLVAAEGWWHREFVQINQKIEDLKRA